MRDNILAISGTIVVAILIAITVVLSIGVDNDAPEITFTGEISYNDRQPIAALLEGVTAKDSRDGDVTSSIMVESLIVLDGGAKAKVTYTAKDKSNNIVKASRIVAYSGSGESIYASSTVVISNEDLTAGNVPFTTEAPTMAPTEPPTTQAPTEAVTEATTPEETTTAEPETTTAAPTAAAGGEAPVLTMTAHEGSINVGGFFNVASYVSNITDNNDTREELFRRIGIEGTYDSYTAGDYTFYVYCIDSDRNVSNKETFVLHVTN